MKKLPPEEKTVKLGINVKETVKAEFYAAAQERHMKRMEGRFFEVMFAEWRELRLLHGLPETELHPTAPNVHGMIFEAGDKTHRIDQDLDEPKHKRDRKHGG
jgi:hypothetical protein